MTRTAYTVIGLAAVAFGTLAVAHGLHLIGSGVALTLLPILLICLGCAGLAASRVESATRSRKDNHHG